MLALKNYQRNDNASYLGCYLVKFQNSSGHFYRNESWIPVQSPFLSSPWQRAVELQSLSYFALKATGYLTNATMAVQGLWDYIRFGDFGGSQANIMAMQVMSEVYLKGYYSLPADYSHDFSFYVNGYWIDCLEFGVDGPFENLIFFGYSGYDLDFSWGTSLSGWLTMDWECESDIDMYLYLIIGDYAEFGTIPEQPRSPLAISLDFSFPTAGAWFGAESRVNQ